MHSRTVARIGLNGGDIYSNIISSSMGVFRIFVGAIILMITMLFVVWTFLYGDLLNVADVRDSRSIQMAMGYPIIGTGTMMNNNYNNNMTIHVKKSLPIVQQTTKSIENYNNNTTVNNSCYQPLDDSKTWWINQTHLSNIDNQPQLDPTFLYQSLLNPWSMQIENQTICYPTSRFLLPLSSSTDYDSSNSSSTTNSTATNRISDYDWQMRLLYLGIYLHQNLPAMKDALARTSCRRQKVNNNNNNNTVSNGDYHCDPTTKYLVVSLPAKGAGATFRAGAVPALLAGLATNRVVIFVNHRPYGTKQMQSRWHLASFRQCPREDIQCFFLPTTPCVLTEQELILATQFPRQPTTLDVLINGRVGRGFTERRIVVIDAKTFLMKLLPNAERRMRERIHSLVVGVANKYNVPPHVLEQMKHPQDLQPLTNLTDPYGNYNRARSTLHHAALLYIFRPNMNFRQELDSIVQEAIPPDFRPEWSFGIPIRASDKCGYESGCLAFSQYMDLAKQYYKKYSNGTTNNNIASIVLTSEEASVMLNRLNYTTSVTFPFRFVINKHDVTQGTGTPRRYRAKDPHKIMLSTMAAIKLQLLSKYIVANCCSSFHQVMLDLLRSGCGAFPSPNIRCLQETDDPQFHVCCEWNQEEPCQKFFHDFRMSKLLETQQNNTQNISMS